MKQIPLTRGYVALVDDSDYERVSALKWWAKVQKGKWRDSVYALHTVYISRDKSIRIRMHRFIMGEDTPEIDHIDGDGLNNQRYNLRPATHAQNGANVRKTGEPTSSRFKGVTRCQRNPTLWRANININKKQKFLGRFREETDAAQAYNLAAALAFGEFARCNEVLP